MSYIKFIKITALSFLMLLPFGSFAADEDCIKEHSYGWCMLDLVGYSKGAKDTPIEKIKPLLEKIQKDGNALPEGSVDKVDLLISAKNFANIGVVPFSPGVAGSLGLLFSVGDFIKNPGEKDQLFIMLPESEVKNGDPRLTIELLFVDGVKKFLNASNAVRKDIPVKTFFGSPSHFRGYLFTGGERCGETGCYAKIKFITNADINPSSVAPNIIENPPSWASKEKIYTWNCALPYIYLEPSEPLTSKSAALPGILKEPEYGVFMKYMPSSFYFYKAGQLGVVFNGGNMNLLVH
jgi:hypothetical protein